MTRLLVIHKGEGAKKDKGKRQPPSYRTSAQVTALLRYALSPNRQSRGKERVAGIVDGMSLGLAEGEQLSPSVASYISRQLTDDIPGKRRLIRHLIIALCSELPIEKQVELLRKACSKYVARYAPGCSFVAILHDDHVGEDQRGLHAHLIIRNGDYMGRAIDWSRDDLREQQGMTWAAGLDVIPTRGTGLKRERGVSFPYPKAEALDAKQVGELSNDQLENLIILGRIKVSRRDKNGVLRSVKLDGRTVRLSTARALIARERGLAASRRTGTRQAGGATRNGIINRVGEGISHPKNKQSDGWANCLLPRRLGFPAWGSPLDGTPRRKIKSRRRAVRAARRKLVSMIPAIDAVDKLGRKL